MNKAHIDFSLFEKMIRKAMELKLPISTYFNEIRLYNKDHTKRLSFYCYSQSEVDCEPNIIEINTNRGNCGYSITKKDWLEFQLIMQDIEKYQEKIAWEDLNSFFPEEKAVHDINDLDDKEDE